MKKKKKKKKCSVCKDMTGTSVSNNGKQKLLSLLKYYGNLCQWLELVLLTMRLGVWTPGQPLCAVKAKGSILPFPDSTNGGLNWHTSYIFTKTFNVVFKSPLVTIIHILWFAFQFILLFLIWLQRKDLRLSQRKCFGNIEISLCHGMPLFLSICNTRTIL